MLAIKNYKSDTATRDLLNQSGLTLINKYDKNISLFLIDLGIAENYIKLTLCLTIYIAMVVP